MAALGRRQSLVFCLLPLRQQCPTKYLQRQSKSKTPDPPSFAPILPHPSHNHIDKLMQGKAFGAPPCELPEKFAHRRRVQGLANHSTGG